MSRNWTDYVNDLSESDKTKLLKVLLDHMLSFGSDSDIRYTNGAEEEDGSTMPECFYWTSCGEPLI